MEKNKKPARSVLGRGLSALISSSPVPVVRGDNLAERRDAEDKAGQVHSASQVHSAYNTSQPADEHTQFIDIDLIVNNPSQPRQEFNEQELSELSDSIKTLGVLQPILVKPGKGANEGKYEIVAGERRWRASGRAQLKYIPVIIHEIDDKQALEIALVENIQRSSLNPIEEAQAYEKLATDFSLSQKDIAERVGKDRASIANYMRLLKLPGEVVSLIKEGKISMGHAKSILTIREPSAQVSLAKKVMAEGLSVRALEAIVARVVVLDTNRAGKKGGRAEGRGSIRNSSFPEVVDRMRNKLGTKVIIKHHPSGRGRVEIEYFSEQELDRIVEIVCG